MKRDQGILHQGLYHRMGITADPLALVLVLAAVGEEVSELYHDLSSTTISLCKSMVAMVAMAVDLVDTTTISNPDEVDDRIRLVAMVELAGTTELGEDRIYGDLVVTDEVELPIDDLDEVDDELDFLIRHKNMYQALKNNTVQYILDYEPTQEQLDGLNCDSYEIYVAPESIETEEKKKSRIYQALISSPDIQSVDLE